MSRPAEPRLRGFFEDAVAEHQRASASAGEVVREIRLGTARVRLRFAGEELAQLLMKALRPRLLAPAAVGEAGEVQATIRLWEQRRVPGGAKPVPWQPAHIGPRGLVRGHDGEDLVAVHEAGSEAVTLADCSAGELLYRVPDASRLPWWERAAPLRPAFFWALNGPGRHLVHAGAVGESARGAVLLAGAGGSGKTTVALAALAAGMAYVGDDYLLLHSDPGPVAWNMYATAKLDVAQLARLPELAPAASISADPEEEEKLVLDVPSLFPSQPVESLPVSAVLLPRIRGGRARLGAATPGEALLALAPSTTFQMPFDNGRVLGALGALVRQVPAFTLDVGDERGELAAAVERVLDAVAAGEQPLPSRSGPRAAVLAP